MTTVTFSEDNNRIRVTAIDHAYGSDAVCNGVSIMMYSLESWLLNNSDSISGHESEFKSGKAEIEFTSVSNKVYTVLDFVRQGLEQVEYTYGDKFLKVNVSEKLKTHMG